MATHSCRENPKDRGAWRATVHGVEESDTPEQSAHDGGLGLLFPSHFH